MNTISGVYIFLVMRRWVLHLLHVCPSPEEDAFPQHLEGISLLINMTEDEVHEGIQTYLV